MKYRIVVIGVLIGIFSISCASNKNKKAPSVDMNGVEQPQPISVGSVEVQLEFIELVNSIAQVEVREVLGYGSSTDRLTPSQTIEVSIHESIMESILSMEEGTVFNAVLAMRPAGVGTSSSWEITEIIDR